MQEMKEVRLPWLIKVPYDWKNKTIRHLLIARDGGVWGNEVSEDETGTICMRIADFDYGKGKFKDCDETILTKRKYPELQVKRLKLEKGDILIEKSGGGEKTPVGRTVLFDKEYIALFANFMERLRFNASVILPEYVEYWLRAWYSCRCSPFYINQTTGIQNINITLMLAKERIYYPSIAQRTNIVSFLNTKCAEIDALAADIQAQIDTLEQYKRSVITEAVTKGLNPDVEMRDSGVAWIGNVPANWKVENPKYHFVQRQERATKGMVQLTASQKYGVVTQTEYMELTGARIVVVQKDFDILKKVCAGDFIIHMRSFQGGLEYSTKSGSISSAYVMLIPQKSIAEPRYYRWFFKSPVYIDALSSTSNLVRDGQAMRWANFIQLPIPIPPADEQTGIADFLDAKCAEIDGIIAVKKQQMEVLAEYKKSLIFEYVTGKKEVPVP